MARLKMKEIIMLVIMLLSATMINAQITAPLAVYEEEIYTDESVFIFCSSGTGAAEGSLTVTTPMGVSSTFSWEIFDTLASAFVPYNANIYYEDTLKQTIDNLEDGLYRVNILSGGTVKEYQAHIINNWVKVTKTDIPDSTSTCEGFQVLAEFESAPLRYFDTGSNNMKSLRDPNIDFSYKWKGGELTSNELNPYFPPIPSNDPIRFDLIVTDEFKCEGKENVQYNSKVPKTEIDADPKEGEAVLKVTFKNSSINYDSIMWYFFKSDSIIAVETNENKGELVDSIDFVLFDKAPVYEYEWTGNYRIKAVTVHVNPTTGNCYDTLYMKDYIKVFESLVEVPNVFTPNGDQFNNEFVVHTESLKSMTIHIYNRWGGLVHSWSYSNIRGRDYTYEHSVWDGKIGSRMASPGVYFYVIRAVGRDGQKQNKNGFVHLFRNKD